MEIIWTNEARKDLYQFWKHSKKTENNITKYILNIYEYTECLIVSKEIGKKLSFKINNDNIYQLIYKIFGGDNMGKKEFVVANDEQLFAGKISGDCWKMPKTSINRQVSGKYYFTDKRIAFLASGLIGTESVSWEIEIKDIATVKTCTTPPFFPFGILITMKNGDKYKLSILKRKKYFEWISEHVA